MLTMAKLYKKLDKMIALRIEKELFDQIKKESQKTGLTLSETIRKMIKSALQKQSQTSETITSQLKRA